MAAKRDEPIYESIYDSIDEIIGKSNGRNPDEIKALKNTIKNLSLKHKLEVATKEKEIQAKEIQMKDMEIEILKLENEVKSMELKSRQKDKTAGTYFSTNNLISIGVEKFFFGKDLNTLFYDSYQEWFEVVIKRLKKNSPLTFEKFLVLKLMYKNPTKEFKFYSYNAENLCYGNLAQLNILDKGWKHGASSVLILHPMRLSTDLFKWRKILNIRNIICG